MSSVEKILLELREIMDLMEVFEKLPKIDIDWWLGNDQATVNLKGTDTNIIVKFSKYNKDSYRTDFSVLDRGNASAVEIFNAAMLTIKEFLKKNPNTKELAFVPFDERRYRIYGKMIKKFLDKSKWEVSEEKLGLGKISKYHLIKRR